MKKTLLLFLLLFANYLFAGTPSAYIGKYKAELLEKFCYSEQYDSEGNIIKEGEFECKGPHVLSYAYAIEILQENSNYYFRFYFNAPFAYGHSSEGIIEREYKDDYGIFHQKDVLLPINNGFNYVQQLTINSEPSGYRNISYLIIEENGKLYFQFDSAEKDVKQTYPFYKTTVHYRFALK